MCVYVLVQMCMEETVDFRSLALETLEEISDKSYILKFSTGGVGKRLKLKRRKQIAN